MGSRTPGDVVWTSWGNVLLFSERVAQKLQDAEISGWSTLPAVVEGADGSQPYRFLVVTGRCGPLDFSRSSRELAVYPGGKELLRGFYFDEDSWDGNDFFMEERPTGWIFVTRRVVDLFLANEIRNVQFEQFAEMESEPGS